MASQPMPAGAASTGAAIEQSRFTVTQLASLVEGALRDHLPKRMKVVGEISNFKERTHWYFELKDAGAVISCVMFATDLKRAGYTPSGGQEVVLTGRVEFWGKAGRTQFYVEAIEPLGAGALDLKFKQLCEELRGLGWFAPERKRAIPKFPRRVAVITSRTGAALQDVLDTMRKRCPVVEVALIDVRVQGDQAAADVARALRWASREHASLGIEAVLLTRGGGSKEDLWTFNERIVAEAVVGCAVPVVAAIGHETDTSIAELCADERCATPTQAAMRLTPDRAALGEQIDALGSRLSSLVGWRMRECSKRLRRAASRACFTDPRACVLDSRRQLEQSQRRLTHVMQARAAGLLRRLDRAAVVLERARPGSVYARRGAQVEHAAVRLRTAMDSALCRVNLGELSRRLAATVGDRVREASHGVRTAGRSLELVGPVSVLRRGYSCTMGVDGKVITSPEQVRSGDVVTTRVAGGAFPSRVEAGAAPNDANTANDEIDSAVRRAAAISDQARRSIGRSKPKRRARGDGWGTRPDQPGLFG
ncbi:MAG: exodeoxyribonuclease VII large subunit [Phycisphaerales bacterium]|nr:exodeoxyribonuclease VII large subunit [Phycisphaerales bacterium]